MTPTGRRRRNTTVEEIVTVLKPVAKWGKRGKSEPQGFHFWAVRNDFSVVQNDFSVVPNDFSVVQNDFSVVRNDFGAVRNDFSVVRKYF